MPKRLIDYRKHGYSQSGEEGVLTQIFKILGIAKGACCEFGAWDGIHLSNTRALMELGWRGLMIEADKERFIDLRKNYSDNSGAICVCEFVDSAANSLAKIAKRNGLNERLDFVSIDIDGLDYECFVSLKDFDQFPKVVCIEAHTCHMADDERELGKMAPGKDPGQPLGLYVKAAKKMGYRLVCFLGTNAFFVHKDAGQEEELPELTAKVATAQNFELVKESKFATEFLYKVNLGLEPPFYRFHNPQFSRRSLEIPILRAIQLRYLNRPAQE